MRIASICAAFAAPAIALSASSAEVVVYSPKDSGGVTLKAPSGALTYPAAWTGHRSVCAVPGASNDVFEAWTGGAAYAVGAPYGTSAGRAWPAVELTEYSPVMPRIDLRTGASDRAPTVAEYVDELYRIVREEAVTDADKDYNLQQLGWTTNNRYTVAAPQSGERVRVVRWVVDGQPACRLGFDAETVLDTRARRSDRAFLTEADILATGALDLDWDKLKSGVVDNFDIQNFGTPVTNVAYLVVIGDGKTAWDSLSDTNSAPRILDRVIERRFGHSRIAPTPVSGSFDGTAARIRFRIDGEGAGETRWGTTYTAFQVFARRQGAATNDWASGIQRLPAKDPATDVYAYTTDDAALAARLSSGKPYDWLCALYNAKYSDTPTAVSSNGLSSASIDIE